MQILNSKISRRLKISLIIFGLSILLIALVVAIDYYRFLHAPLKSQQARIEYHVQPGVSIRKVSQDLAALEFLSHPAYLEFYARSTGQAMRIQSGEYEIDSQQTPIDLLLQLTAGKVRQHSFTIVEGWTFQQLLTALAKVPALEKKLTGLNQTQIMTALGYPDVHPEGRFLPDTYYFPKGVSDIDFLRRAYQAMQTELERIWSLRDDDLPLQTAYEALILASIIERETAVAEERRQIAGVFIERLRRGMRLQTDPTVIYGMGDKFRGNIRTRDLRRDTPYNTYTRSGLPPTPIAMPSAAALYAAVHPLDDGALFFVSRGDGTHEFSATLEAHNRAVIKYQLNGDASRLRRSREQ